jgi:hypothetical protein
LTDHARLKLELHSGHFQASGQATGIQLVRN